MDFNLRSCVPLQPVQLGSLLPIGKMYQLVTTLSKGKKIKKINKIKHTSSVSHGREGTDSSGSSFRYCAGRMERKSTDLAKEFPILTQKS